MANSPLSDSPESQLNADLANTTDQFLQLRLDVETPVLLPIRQITEVLNVPEEQIMPIPHMPAWVMGVYNWRGEILWIVDLGHLCELTPWYHQRVNRSTRSTVILNGSQTASAKGMPLGLVVSQIEDIQFCNPAKIQHSALLENAVLRSFSQGCWLKADGNALAILNSAAILAKMPQRN